MTTTTPGTASLFALTPGQLNTGTIIQMDTKAGREMYNKAIQPLKVPFDGDSKNINMFQTQLQRRIEMCGWDKDSGDIILIKDNKNDLRNLITEYGCLTARTLEADADTWVEKETRKAQNHHMMVECMMASITESCFYKIPNKDGKYTQRGVKVAFLLFKLLMAKIIVDIRATTY